MAFKEIREELSHKKYLDLSVVSSLTPDILDYHNSFFCPHSDESISTFISERTFQEHQIIVDSESYINFLFTYKGSNFLSLREKMSHINNIDVIILINARSYMLTQKPGEVKKLISFMVLPEVLLEVYGLNMEIMPFHIRSALLGYDKTPLVLKIGLPPRARICLETIFDTDMQGATFQKYMSVKAEELLCEAVNTLNKSYAAKTYSPFLSKEEKLTQAIESAAFLYRQSVGKKLNVSLVAQKIGVNRNALNSGFKDLFGMSPAEYGRIQTLEWARSQLVDGRYTLKSISEASGYGNVTSFSRAYSAQYGVPPIKSVRFIKDD